MRLTNARVQNYRSIFDTGEFDVENAKTILVGSNEAGKTAVLQALQKLNPPSGTTPFKAIRDYPRSQYDNITTGKIKPEDIEVVEGVFELDAADKAAIPIEFRGCKYKFSKRMDNTTFHSFVDEPEIPYFKDLKKDFTRLCAHLDSRHSVSDDDDEAKKPSDSFNELTSEWSDFAAFSGKNFTAITEWLENQYPNIDEENETEEARYDKIIHAISLSTKRSTALKTLNERLPVFVLFSNYFRVRPNMHLEKLANRIEQNSLEDETYDYGNKCLLKLLGFEARQLSDLGKSPAPSDNSTEKLEAYREKLDDRQYRLNASSIRLTKEIKQIWNPDETKGEAAKLVLKVDGQYLKAVVEDSIGVEIELDQRSEGFQWLVSFFVVFFAEAMDDHKNAILLLDEPGQSLHALKQREFRNTISRLADENQTLYSTHSPFLVGPDELDLVRVIEMANRETGTKVHTSVTSSDPASLLPLQEALGYDLAQSLFTQSRNLILEGLTDYWYVEAVSALLREGKIADLNTKISLIPAASAGKVVYFATILHAQNLKVAALLDSDNAGNTAATHEVLVHQLGNKNILRTADFEGGEVKNSEIEDLLRETLIDVVKSEYNMDVKVIAKEQATRAIVDIFAQEVPDFSKYKLAKSFLRWCKDHSASDLTKAERENWSKLVAKLNSALK